MKKIIGAGLVASGVITGGVYIAMAPSEDVKTPAITQPASVEVSEFQMKVQENAGQGVPSVPQNSIAEDVPVKSVEVIEVEAPQISIGELPQESATSVQDAGFEMREPVIKLQDPALATERGLTVTMYPSFLNDRPSPEEVHDRKIAQKQRDGFNDGDVVVGRYIASRQLFQTDSRGFLPHGMMTAPGGKHVATGFIDIPKDGFYYIYPIEDIDWSQMRNARLTYRNGYSEIFQNHLGQAIAKTNGVISAPGSSITLKVGAETVFDFYYTPPEGRQYQPIRQVFSKVYLEKGRYPFEGVFSAVSHQNSKSQYQGVNIMVHRSESVTDESWDFIYTNKTRARLMTEPLGADDTAEASVSDPVDVIYADQQFDIKQVTPSTGFTKTYQTGALNHFQFTLTPEVAGSYVIGQKIWGDVTRSIFNAGSRAENPELFSCYSNGTYASPAGSGSFRDEGFYMRDGIASAVRNAQGILMEENTVKSGGSTFILDVTPEMVSTPVTIEVQYACRVGTWQSDAKTYMVEPLLKTPGNNSFLPLEDFAVKEQ